MFSEEPIEDGDAGEPQITLIDGLIEMVHRRGPIVLEVWECGKCGHESYCFHAFHETIGCGNCNHPRASQVNKYLSLCESIVDSK